MWKRSKSGMMRKMTRQTIMLNGKWREGMTADERYRELSAIMQNVIPFNPYQEGRSFKNEAAARKLIEYQMRLDGFPVINIARALNRKHATIVKQTNGFAKILTYKDRGYLGYFEDVRAWKQFSSLVAEADKDKAEPVCSRIRVITLGEFRKFTEEYPDEIVLRVTDGSSKGFNMRPSFDGNEIIICTR